MAKVTRLRAFNYRSIGAEVDIHFPAGCPIVLVGENNCGKSNLVHALDLVLGQTWPGSREPDDNEFHLRDRGRAMWISIDFDEGDRFGGKYEQVLWRYDSAAYFGASRSPISVHVDHPFRSMAITHFGRSRSPVSVDVDQ
jgi:energy-coupling factor transporter ATP-binding protein EcfA2